MSRRLVLAIAAAAAALGPAVPSAAEAASAQCVYVFYQGELLLQVCEPSGSCVLWGEIAHVTFCV